MKALVTGATGFLGQKLALRLKELGLEVTASGRNREIGQQLTKKHQIPFHPLNLADREETWAACQEQDYVFHCAALSSPWGPYSGFYTANVLATRHVVEGCKRAGIRRLIHVSTPSIYFDFTDRFNISEDEPLPKKGVNPYAATKRLAEDLIDQAFAGGLPVVTLRPRAIFGPGDNALFPRLIRANDRGFLPLIGGGKALADVTYVENVVDALILAMDSPTQTLGKKYNITNGQPMALGDLLAMLFSRLNQPLRSRSVPYPLAYSLARAMEGISRILPGKPEPLLTPYSVGVLAKSQTLDIRKAQEELGYQPRISIEEGLEKFAAEWSRDHVHKDSIF